MVNKLFLLVILTFVSMTFFMSSVSSLGFSPSSLVFNLSMNQTGCGVIKLTSDTPLFTVSDTWGENKDVNWSVKDFKTSSSELNITMSYPKNLTLDMRDVELCLSGSTPGEYHGVIIFAQAEQGGAIVQLGVWLKLTINDEVQPPVIIEDDRVISYWVFIGILSFIILLFVINRINK